MKKIYSHSKFFIVKKHIFATLFVIIICDFSIAQWSAEDSLFQEANYFLNNGYYKSAINSLEKLLELNPNSAEAYGLLGNVYNLQGDFDVAIQMYHKCIGLDSSAIPIIMNLGNAYIDAGKLDSAIAIHKFLIAKDSSNVANYVNLGDAYMKNQEIVKAQDCFIKAIDLNYYCTLAHVNLAMTYYDQKNYIEAIDELFLVRNMDEWYPLLQYRCKASPPMDATKVLPLPKHDFSVQKSLCWSDRRKHQFAHSSSSIEHIGMKPSHQRLWKQNPVAWH